MDRIDKLPKWAQEEVKDLERKYAIAMRKLDEFTDNQTPSNIYYDDLLCTTSPPETRRTYIQSRRVTVYNAGVVVNMTIMDDEIHISYGSGSSDLGGGAAALIPISFQSFRLSTLENAWPKR